MTKPEVFIIESLTFDNEKENLFEGKIISDILHLSGKSSIYYYIRTKAEFEEVLSLFCQSNYRYLHISCHGNRKMMFTTLDEIPFDEMAKILESVLEYRRLFLSACSMTNENLAKSIIPASDCYSIIGPAKDVHFNDAAILWSSFYHLMFKDNAASMKRSKILENAKSVAKMFKIPLNYYSKSKSQKSGFKHTLVNTAS